MTKDQLIVKQQIEIADLKEKVFRLSKSVEKIRVIIYCIGGPLNDNALGYSRKQLSTFYRIINAIDEVE